MNISSITIKGFRCFDDNGQTIPLDHLSCFVGPNGSGKTGTPMGTPMGSGLTFGHLMLNYRHGSQT